jgi:peptidoglycan/xylan/chitin deacetylase (PgdA/CDA1 family)
MWHWAMLCCRGWKARAGRLALLAALLWPTGSAWTADSAVIFLYQRFADPRLPEISIELAQFEAHLAEIAAGRLNVAPLDEVVGAFRRRESLPERTIAITIDGADASVWNQAWPRLRRAGLPFTLFVATDAVDSGRPGYMTWDQIRELAASGVTIGSQATSGSPFPELDAEAKRREMARANQRFAEELGFVPTLFAYPFGEYGLADKQAAHELGFEAAFGQHSGVGHAEADLYALPRFLMNAAFGSLERFRLAAAALPLYLTDLTPADTVLGSGDNPPSFGFTLAPDQGPLETVQCYASNRDGPLSIEALKPRRIEVRLATPFAPGRARINCTMPADAGHWRWFGLQFYIRGG